MLLQISLLAFTASDVDFVRSKMASVQDATYYGVGVLEGVVTVEWSHLFWHA